MIRIINAYETQLLSARGFFYDRSSVELYEGGREALRDSVGSLAEDRQT